jgi:hypothetical protein
MSGFNPTHRVMAGDRLVASILPIGNGSPKAPRRFLIYWSTSSSILNPPLIERPTAKAAAADAVAWAKQHFNDLQVVRRIRA